MTLHQVRWPISRLVWSGGSDPFPFTHTGYIESAHQPGRLIPADIVAGPASSDPLMNGMNWGHGAVLTVLVILLIALSVVLFQRRDLRQTG